MNKFNLSLMALVLSTAQLASAQSSCVDLFKDKPLPAATQKKQAGLSAEAIKDIVDQMKVFQYYQVARNKKSLIALSAKLDQHDLRLNPELIHSLFVYGTMTVDISYSVAVRDAGKNFIKKLTDLYPEFDYLAPRKINAADKSDVEALEKYMNDSFSGFAVMNFGKHMNVDTFYNMFIQQSRKEGFNDPVELANKLMNWGVITDGAPAFSFKIPDYNTFQSLKAILKNKIQGTNRTYQEVLLISDNKSSRLHFVAVSNRPIEGYSERRLGIYVKQLRVIESKETLVDENFSWKVNGQELKANLSFKRGHKVTIKLDSSPAPKYEAMLEDKKLTGAILISSNMDDFVPMLFQNYDKYLKKNGFSSEVTETTGLDSFRNILHQSQKGEFDYVIREGHAESATENMIVMSDRVEVHEYTKKNANFDEVVYLYTPVSEFHSSTGLNLGDFGQALRNRPNPQAPIIYYDSACLSYCRVGDAVKLVANNGLLPISSASFVDTFTPVKGNAGFEILEGIRKQSSYEQIRAKIDLKEENMIFPDQIAPEIGQKKTTILDINIQRHFNEEIE